jgi:hypothetical protein
MVVACAGALARRRHRAKAAVIAISQAQSKSLKIKTAAPRLQDHTCERPLLTLPNLFVKPNPNLHAVLGKNTTLLETPLKNEIKSDWQQVRRNLYVFVSNVNQAYRNKPPIPS